MNKERNYFKTFRTSDIELKPLLKTIDKDVFLRHQLIANIKNTFSLLGYDLENENIYAVINRGEWKWLKTINHKYNRKIWNYKIKESEEMDIYYDLSEHILKHCFPLELKNCIPKKTKYISNKEDQIGAHYIEYDMCGSYFKNISNILCIDIDCHDRNNLKSYNTLYSLLKIFNNEYIYIEKSYEGSYHIFIKLDKEYSIIEKKEFLNNIKEQHNLSNIEIPIKMRFPFSYHYEPYSNDFNDVKILESLEIIKNNYDKQYGYILQAEQKEKSQKVVPIISSIYSRQRQSKIKHVTPEEFLHNNEIDESKEKISIFKGHRNNPMLKICQISNFNNWSNEETLDVIKQLDQGSKDLSRWSDNYTLKVIENMKNTCTNFYKESISCKPEKFISNINLLPDWLSSTLSDKRLLDKTIIKCKYKITGLNRRKFTLALQEIFGAILYDCKNNRTTLNNRGKKYLIGKQFSSQYAQLMNKYYSEEFNSVDFHSIIISILKYSGLFSQYKSNSRGWNFNSSNKEGNFCKQYDLSNNKNHMLFIDINIVLYLIIQLLGSFKILNHNKLFIIQDFFNKIHTLSNDFIIEEIPYLLDVG